MHDGGRVQGSRGTLRGSWENVITGGTRCREVFLELEIGEKTQNWGWQCSRVVCCLELSYVALLPVSIPPTTHTQPDTNTVHGEALPNPPDGWEIRFLQHCCRWRHPRLKAVTSLESVITCNDCLHPVFCHNPDYSTGRRTRSPAFIFQVRYPKRALTEKWLPTSGLWSRNKETRCSSHRWHISFILFVLSLAFILVLCSILSFLPQIKHL